MRLPLIPICMHAATRIQHATLLRQGLSLALLRPRPLAGDLPGLVWLVALGLGCALFADWRYAPAEAVLAPWGVLAEAARYGLWLAGLGLIGLLLPTRASLLALAVGLAGAELIVWALWLVLDWLGPLALTDHWEALAEHLGWGVLAWQVAIFVTALRSLRIDSLVRGVSMTVLHALGLYLGTVVLPDHPLFEGEPSAPLAVDVETLYYRQPALVDAALARIEPGVPGTQELFVVTFAGFGSEDVFMRESLAAGRVLEARFGAQDRVLHLVNNPATVTRHPVASVSNLVLALHGLAARMQPQEDLLLVLLTSHGAEDGEFAVSLGDLGLNPLYPETLREVLAQAGIRWQVVVISACYSGTYLDALAGPETLLITAAAADRTSFGCEHRRRWTYFGEAYFNEALRETHSFTEAFVRARKQVIAREKGEGKTPSKPQMALGAQIAPVLDVFANARAAQPPVLSPDR